MSPYKNNDLFDFNKMCDDDVKVDNFF